MAWYLQRQHDRAHEAIMAFCRSNTHTILTINCPSNWKKTEFIDSITHELTSLGLFVAELCLTPEKTPKSTAFVGWLRVYLAVNLHCGIQIIQSIHANDPTKYFSTKIIAEELYHLRTRELIFNMPSITMDVWFVKAAGCFPCLQKLGKRVEFREGPFRICVE